MLQCIIFDVDGTLINTEKAILLSLKRTVKVETGRDESLENLTFAFGIPGRVALQKLEVPDIDRAMRRWIQYTYDYADEVSVFDGLEAALNSLKNKGITIGIVTSQTSNELEELLQHFNIRHYFDILISASDTKKHKPDPEPMLAFLEKAHVDRNDCLYVGDTEYDQKCASGAGVAFALALWGTKERDMETPNKLERPSDILNFCE